MSKPSQLDPVLRERLLKEARTPWRSLRRALWFTLFASAAVGAATMAMRSASGVAVPFSDLGIQSAALLISVALIWLDRNRQPQH
ncbi:MAG: DUF3493 domain-containing protein [Cyanobacteria bacterium]|nr:DUF3493 domain-containing protein [Cyanobacteriota bacterium]MDA1169680.1 DUF3493 domain-containing protein [Cyanobacteriota bacterium]